MELAGERAGGSVLSASDDFFAEKENLIKDALPVFVPDKYTDRGKWMDGWESRRKRTPGHDWAIIRLGIPGVIRGVVIDTSFFTGNYPEQASIEACEAAAEASANDLKGWTELLPRTSLAGDSKNVFGLSCSRRFTHLRLNIFPDGGVARLRVHGVALPDWRGCDEIDLAAAANGAAIVDVSDRHYGHPQNMIMPGVAKDMRDGWETRRRRGPGHDWVVLRLAAEGILRRAHVDTAHFKGNYPDTCALDLSAQAGGPWREVLPQAKLEPHAQRDFSIDATEPARFARFRIYPDGGVSRLKLIGRLTETGRMEARLAWLSATSEESAKSDLLRCCGSETWGAGMTAARPFAEPAELWDTADRIWAECGREDWLQAFAAHPKIGAKSASAWSQQEQAGAMAADAAIIDALAEANRAYESRFGFQFIVCASGKTAGEMLDLLRARLGNDAEAELRNAAEQQRLITRLRLRKLLSE